jgi:hypothetical protein
MSPIFPVIAMLGPKPGVGWSWEGTDRREKARGRPQPWRSIRSTGSASRPGAGTIGTAKAHSIVPIRLADRIL